MNFQTKSSTQNALRLEARDFAIAFDDDISGYVANRIKAFDFSYRSVPNFKRDEWLLNIAETLIERDPERAGEHRLPAWEKGWSENLSGSLIPKYFGKFMAVRWCREFVQPIDSRFEYEAFGIIKDWLFDKHFRVVDSLYEFGCGTGHNLINAHRVNPNAMLRGLDWTKASVRLINENNAALFDGLALGQHFDFFNPDGAFQLSNAGVFTAAALEQTGERFRPFIDWLIERRPGIVIHIEPINELLDPKNLMDYLSIQYARKRGYLSGLLDYLRKREADGAIEIVTAKRTGIGSLFLDGYSVIVWRPK